MNKKDFIELHLDYFYGEPLTKDIKKRFKWFVRLKENRNELIKNCERINWSAIGNYCLNQINDLIKETRMPEIMDGSAMMYYSRKHLCLVMKQTQK